jgi:hypothetical protein
MYKSSVHEEDTTASLYQYTILLISSLITSFDLRFQLMFSKAPC